MNVEHKEYTGKGQGNFNSVGAAAGIASFLGIDAGDISQRFDHYDGGDAVSEGIGKRE